MNNRSNPERNKQLKVAQFANPRHAQTTKAEALLNSRRAGYTATLNDPMNRGKDLSGYHRPGSMQGPR